MVVWAQEEARGLGHKYIGTEHELLGLLRVPEGAAAEALGSFGITAEYVREEILKIVGAGETPVTGQIPFTARAKKVLELSLREALALGHNVIRSEHLLLGLISQTEGVANRILLDRGADSESIRTALKPLLPGPDPTRVQSSSSVSLAGPTLAFRVGPAASARRLLMAAAGRALADGREAFTIDDLLLALADNDETTAQAMREAIEKRARAAPPPDEAAEP